MSLTATQLAAEVVHRAAAQTRPLQATYRVQFTPRFTLPDAAALVPYLHQLGVSHLYASPYLKARPGSNHGYDVCDHGQINPELCGPEGHARLLEALRERQMGHILDVVPNHMSASSHNPWWMDVLENGPSSPYAGYFDIDWLPVKDELAHKVLLPILGRQYGEVLENGELKLVHMDGGFLLEYYEHTLPLGPKTTLPLLTHRLDELRQALGRSTDECLEYESILTAIENLPPQTETSPEAVLVRQREKEVIKRRLRDLEARAPAVAECLAQNVAEFNGRPGEPASFDRLDGLLAAQAYRLCHWRAASDEINYRRFFDVNELAALAMESPEVFFRAHRLVGRLLAQGDLQGLRIDHIDGLRYPEQYLWRLQWHYLAELARTILAETGDAQAVEPTADTVALLSGALREACTQLNLPPPDEADLQAVLGPAQALAVPAAVGAHSWPGIPHASGSPPTSAVRNAPLYVVVEKILGPDEPLPESWPTAGTTGYDFIKALGGLFIDPAGFQEVERVYQRFTDQHASFDEVAYEAKQTILRFSMASELQMLAHQLNRISEQHRRSRDFTLNMLRHALREILANFPVYRTYASPAGVSDRDRKFVHLAIARAKRRNQGIDPAVFDFVREVLLLEHPPGLSPSAVRQREAFTGRFQQVTSPVMAKGVEDTAFYVYCPLLSANEVGGDPRAPTCSIADFHRENAQRQACNPLALLASSTHDTKRSEDVRARISVLAEFPGRWKQAVNRWARLNRRHLVEVDGLPAPSRNDEYIFYQSLFGVWPIEPPTGAALTELVERLQNYMEKVGHEAKQRTSWVNPNAAYDQALRDFVARVLEPGKRNRFLADFQAFLDAHLDYGLYTALGQVVLKLTSPGVPDLFQGQELWDFSLVDPDNRRPVDYERRRWLLGEIDAQCATVDGQARLARQLGAAPRDARLKLLVTRHLLALRRQQPQLFAAGHYLPLEVQGERQQHVVAFARRFLDPQEAQQTLLVIIPRLVGQLLDSRAAEADSPRTPCGPRVWGDTTVRLPWPIAGRLKNVLAGTYLEPAGTEIRVGDALAPFPAAVLLAE